MWGCRGREPPAFLALIRRPMTSSAKVNDTVLRFTHTSRHTHTALQEYVYCLAKIVFGSGYHHQTALRASRRLVIALS